MTYVSQDVKNSASSKEEVCTEKPYGFYFFTEKNGLKDFVEWWRYKRNLRSNREAVKSMGK
jgi:hypothetical protein